MRGSNPCPIVLFVPIPYDTTPTARPGLTAAAISLRLRTMPGRGHALDRAVRKRQRTTTLEKRLWDAADQFRANSGLKAQEYSGPVLGLIFLRFAEVRFAAQRAKLEKAGASSRRGSSRGRTRRLPRRGHPLPARRGAVRLPAAPCPKASDIGAKVNAAMRDIEKHNPQLAGVLPKTYNLFTSTLLKELLKKVSEIPASRGLRRLRAHLRILPRRVRPHRGPEGRRVLHAEQHRPPAHRGHRAVPRPHPRPRVRLGRHVRAVRAVRGRAQEEPRRRTRPSTASRRPTRPAASAA